MASGGMASPGRPAIISPQRRWSASRRIHFGNKTVTIGLETKLGWAGREAEGGGKTVPAASASCTSLPTFPPRTSSVTLTKTSHNAMDSDIPGIALRVEQRLVSGVLGRSRDGAGARPQLLCFPRRVRHGGRTKSRGDL